MNTNLSNADRLALICGSLAAFAVAPTNSRKSDLTKAITEYQNAWVANHKTETLFGEELESEIMEMMSNEGRITGFLQAIRHAVIESDAEVLASLAQAADAAADHGTPF